jgi:hypothetical protein
VLCGCCCDVDAYQALEGELADEELRRLLVATNLTESDGTRLIAMGLLDTTGRRGALAGGLGGKLLARSLATSGLAGGLLGASHCCRWELVMLLLWWGVEDERCGCEMQEGKMSERGGGGKCFNTRGAAQ